MHLQTEDHYSEGLVDAGRLFAQLAPNDQVRLCQDVVALGATNDLTVRDLRQCLATLSRKGKLRRRGFRPGRIHWSVETLVAAARRSPNAARLLVRAWIVAHEGLFRDVSRRMDAGEVPDGGDADGGKAVTAFVRAVAAELPDAAEAQIRIAYLLRKGGIVIRQLGPAGETPGEWAEDPPQESEDGDDERTSDRLSSALFSNWLRELQQLDPDVPEWEQVGAFVKAIQGVAESKLAERARTSLASERAALLETYSAELEWMGRTIPSLTKLPSGAAGREKLEQIRELLGELQQIRAECRQSLARERQLQPRRDQLLQALEAELVEAPLQESAQPAGAGLPMEEGSGTGAELPEAANSDWPERGAPD